MAEAVGVTQPPPRRTGGTTGAIVVNTRQKANPVLEHVRNVAWEFGDTPADFTVGATSCALFLSLQYHRLHPEYIYNRIQALGRGRFDLRVLLVMVDIDHHQDPLRELSKTCIVNRLTLILAWSAGEAGRYLETLKSYELTQPTAIMETHAPDYSSRLQDALTAVRGVNRNDAVSLVANFGSVRRALNAEVQQLELVEGWGHTKAQRLYDAANQPLLSESTTKLEAPELPKAPSAPDHSATPVPQATREPSHQDDSYREAPLAGNTPAKEHAGVFEHLERLRNGYNS